MGVTDQRDVVTLESWNHEAFQLDDELVPLNENKTILHQFTNENESDAENTDNGNSIFNDCLLMSSMSEDNNEDGKLL